ncbi:recombinase family protein [Thermopolyspora sp. NPDC052614]|uniref:recombinase family protein n=1 Tax=Thermopolyspora sp. NPDC052614 TaxID=3155682 RepID=UPI00344568BA
MTAPVVVRIFHEFVGGDGHRRGKGLQLIAEGLTRDGIPCPSAYDAARNRHRSGVAWAGSAVRAILLAPRYTADRSGTGSTSRKNCSMSTTSP